MQIIEGILLNCIYVLFPLAIYLIINTYNKNIDTKTNNLFFEIALFSSLYLLFKYGKSMFSVYPMIIFNVPLLIAYLKKKNITAIIISILLILYYHNHTSIGYITLGVEYLVYFLIYNYHNFKNESPIFTVGTLIVIKSFVISLKTFLIFNPENSAINNFSEITLTMLIFLFVAYICIYLLEKAEEILDFNSVIHQLEKEKALRNSIFKITHEIKNPIAVCKGYLDMIDYKDENKVRKYIPIVKDQIDRTLVLMDDFLDYTKVKINKDEVDLYLLIEDSCEISYPLFKKEGIKLEYDTPDDELYINLDYNRMKQVLVNIFKNSIEAKDKKKKNPYVRVTVNRINNEIVMKIKDNGLGMDKKTIKRVDEMFYTTKEKGTGLGVALSKEIIELHGGSIKYTSQKNKYTLVTIKLPLK